MIFYFTGTGNSLQVAKDISKYHGEKLFSISAAMHKGEESYEYILKDDEKIGFVFPVYAWGAPKMVLDFIAKLKLSNFKDNYVFAVATCGENIGSTMKAFEDKLKKRNIILNSGFSVVMPSNYMIMGMDVDSIEESKKKLLKADKILKEINKVIEEKQKGIFQLEKGHLPNILTSVINPLFTKFSISTEKFYAKDNCISCGICEKVCNTKTIRIDRKPTWGDKCTQCLACINICPVRAIEYGKATVKKGRYKNPNITVDELVVE
ncbi:EFR1 family ferrodoxin [Alkaliphilus sp. MSJ-5]|uniref:Ferredoxin n=1 Tax=Alkaliphilus flagellatus TaxID=2841507 RepID=A0ABS6G327_9FIRM|nr:EFR1 family ferrodoxin [Alkaliphilus flagellatus]MBU5676127.1 EFR1 family ferrodoxin [Alkaliphilus flagellatus]